jgi:lysophospholipase L1-like esterase
MAHGLALIDIADDARWTETMYRDGVHPTKEGNGVLALILEEAVRRHQVGC